LFEISSTGLKLRDVIFFFVLYQSVQIIAEIYNEIIKIITAYGKSFN